MFIFQDESVRWGGRASERARTLTALEDVSSIAKRERAITQCKSLANQVETAAALLAPSHEGTLQRDLG